MQLAYSSSVFPFSNALVPLKQTAVECTITMLFLLLLYTCIKYMYMYLYFLWSEI